MKPTAQDIICRAAKTTAIWLTWLLLSVTVVCAATIGYARYRGLTILSVQTGSMRPTINPGDAVLVREDGDIAKGAVISYHSLSDPKAVITHRVISYDAAGGRIITKGDALASADPPIGRDRVVGSVEHVVPAIGYDLDLVRRPAGLMAAVYLPAAVLIAGEMQRLTRYYAGRRYRLYAYRW